MMKKSLLIAIGVASMDQAIKAYVRSIPVGKVFFEIPGLVSLTHSVNTGAAFSLFSGETLMLSVLSLGLLAAMYVYALKRMRLTVVSWIAIGCLFGGGIGNLMDRLLFSGVTDYIRLLVFDFPVFNLADMAITGAIGVLIFLLFTDTLEEAAEDEHGSDC